MEDRPQTKFDAERKAAFLLAYERSTEITAAAAAVGVTRQTVYKHLRDDPEFAEAFELADGRVDEMMMRQLKKVSIDGVEKKTFDAEGNVTSVTRVYDNRCLLAWLKRRRRSDWGDQVKVEQTGNVTHTHRTLDPKKIPRVARNRLRDAFQALGDAADDGDDPSRN